MGRQVRRAEHLDTNGGAEPILLVAQGSFDLTIRVQGVCIAVALVVDVSAETRGQFARMAARLQGKALLALRAHLFQQPRTSARIEPAGAETIGAVERLVVEQIIRIATDDPSSFNRLADGLQEVASAAAGAFSKVGAIVGAATEGADRQPGPPPTGMYG
jgi:hypothetical protein